MRDFLVFTLFAPMASHGDVAGHARRGGHAWPARSAVLGLIGAALGVKRDDDEGQRALADGYGVAVLVLKPGAILRDYHTVQTVPAAKVKSPATRAEAVAAAASIDGLNTIVSQREYRMDTHFRACLYARGQARWPLKTICDALERPGFVLYLGRKACPLAAPLDPRIRPAADAREALLLPDPKFDAAWSVPDARALTLVSDPDGIPDDLKGARRESRWDQPVDRRRWHFAPRDAIVVPLDAADGS